MDSDTLNSLVSCLLPLSFFVIFIGIAVFSSVAMRRRITEGWGSLAARTGLRVESLGQFALPEVRGDFEGRPVKLWTYSVRHGKSSTRYTAMQMGIKNDANYNLSIRREGALDSIGKAFGMQDIQIGDAEFDRQFVIKSNPDTIAKALLGGGTMVREAVKRIPRGGIDVMGSSMTYKQVALETNSETLYTILQAMREIGNAIEGVSGTEPAEYREPEEKPESVWASDGIASDPFYQKKAPQADPFGKYGSSSYNPSNDPFGPPPTAQGPNLKVIGIALFILADLACAAAFAYYFFFMMKPSP